MELPYHLGNVVKYRPGRISTYQDLQKAQFYLNRFISKLDYKQEERNQLAGFYMLGFKWLETLRAAICVRRQTLERCASLDKGPPTLSAAQLHRRRYVTSAG